MREKLVVRGFYGRGNCGDEAILQTIYDFFSSRYDIVISTDMHGVNSEMLYKMHPYDKSMVIHSEERAIFKGKEVAGFLLGGGGLGTGFGFNQWIVAKRSKKKIIHAGTHIDAGFFKGIFQEENVDYASGFSDVGGLFTLKDVRDKSDDKYNNATKAFLNLADYTAVRNSASRQVCEHMGINALYRPDWVFGMERDNSEEVKDDWRRMVVVIREYPPEHSDYTSLRIWVEKIKQYAEKLGMYVKFLPFCGEDADYLRKINLYKTGENVIDGQYWNPKRVKEWIAKSGMTVTFGRFHPIVFAISEGTPIISIDYNFENYKNKGSVLMEDSRLGKFLFNKKDERRDLYDFFKEAMSDKNIAMIKSIGQTNKKLVHRMRDEIINTLTS